MVQEREISSMIKCGDCIFHYSPNPGRKTYCRKAKHVSPYDLSEQPSGLVILSNDNPFMAWHDFGDDFGCLHAEGSGSSDSPCTNLCVTCAHWMPRGSYDHGDCGMVHSAPLVGPYDAKEPDLKPILMDRLNVCGLTSSLDTRFGLRFGCVHHSELSGGPAMAGNDRW